MSSNLSHRLTDEIKQDIMSGAFEPGARLKTEVLADRYNVSANPVREALWRLQGEGFVVTTPNHGARVRVIDDDFIRNIFELREIIEPVFVRRFCLRASSHDLDRLEVAQERFIKEADQEPLDFYRLDSCNREFHKIIVENEPNSEALQVIERHGDIINAARSRLALTRGRSLTRIKEHGAIIAALRIADADTAVAAAAAHVRSARDDFLEQMSVARSQSIQKR